jgi:hypothetical protein
MLIRYNDKITNGVLIMKMYLLKIMFASAALTLVTFAGGAKLRAQDGDHKSHDHEAGQKSVASKSAKFESVAKTDALYKGALDAHDKDAAAKMSGKDGAIKGKVAKLFSPRGGSVLILNFDEDYKTALTAVVKKDNFSKFPDLSQLDGKEIVVSGKFTDFKGSPQIELSDPKQITVVK